MNVVTRLSIGFVALFSSTVASADLISFDFTTGGTREDNQSLTFTEGGISVNLEGWFTNRETAPFDGGWTNDNSLLTNDSDGIGYNRGSFDSSQIDGLGPNELVKFSFSPDPFSLVDITFGAVGSNDDFSLFVDSDGDSFVFDGLVGQFDIPGSNVFSFIPELTDFPIGVGAGFGIGRVFSNDDFFIRGLTVRAHAVPAPGAMGLFLIGFACLGVARRRQRRFAS